MNPVDPGTGEPYDGVGELIRDTSAHFDGAAYGEQLIAEHGTLNNFDFLTGDLPQSGNAGDQLLAQMEQLLADLRAAYPTVSFIGTVGAPSFLGGESFSLYGGPLPADPSTVVLGQADVDIYQLDVTVTVDVIIEHHIVDTTVAHGTFAPPPGFGPPMKLVTAGTPLTNGAAELIRDTSLLFDGVTYGEQLVSNFGTLSNFDFLTADLLQSGNAGIQLETQMEQLLADLQAAHPGVPNPSDA